MYIQNIHYYIIFILYIPKFIKIIKKNNKNKNKVLP